MLQRPSGLTAAASAGVAALIVASEPAFTAVRLLGAAYLVFLGLQSLWHAVRRTGSPHAGPITPRNAELPPRTALRQGIVSDLGNPKIAVFFTSLLPQFAPAGGGAFAVMFALGLLFGALTFAWLVSTRPSSRGPATCCAGRGFAARWTRCSARHSSRSACGWRASAASDGAACASWWR